MHKVNVDDLFEGKQSKYALVVGVSKRAREITDEALENKDKAILNEKPVKTAVDELASGEYKIIEDPSLR